MFKKLCLVLTFALLAINIFARDVKVLISEDKNNVTITASAPFKVRNLETNKLYKVKKGGTFTINNTKGQITCGNLESKKGFTLTLAEDGANFTLNNYRSGTTF
ncbi:MAG: hypothetical protein II726_00465, partial [Elusimicrobiaceae bacterium]|nr:hypothetical protein [Elusimicrobiaceae bacterium]